MTRDLDLDATLEMNDEFQAARDKESEMAEVSDADLMLFVLLKLAADSLNTILCPHPNEDDRPAS